MYEDQKSEIPAETDDRSQYGRVKFGGGHLPALWLAAPIGLIFAIAIAAVAVATNSAGPRPIVGGTAITVVLIWPCLGLVWAMIVDRDTLRGATADPEQSVESVWYEKAASGAFSDILFIIGLGTAAVAFTGIEMSTVLVLAGVILIAMGSFAIRYLIQKRQS
ncbi:MAG: hypothetical protein ACTHW1_10720 [Ancrocorticia sp.]|uniref:hypothetical protein n=1 Tax=Ancrocorticia sp. TaxID=2593684 RepID=UPI003F92DF64